MSSPIVAARYREVALTYLRKKGPWHEIRHPILISLVFAIACRLLAGVMGWDMQGAISVLLVGQMQIAMACASSGGLAVQLREQLDSESGRLAPGFRGPHLLIVATIYAAIWLIPIVPDHRPAALAVLTAGGIWSVFLAIALQFPIYRPDVVVRAVVIVCLGLMPLIVYQSRHGISPAQLEWVAQSGEVICTLSLVAGVTAITLALWRLSAQPRSEARHGNSSVLAPGGPHSADFELQARDRMVGRLVGVIRSKGRLWAIERWRAATVWPWTLALALVAGPMLGLWLISRGQLPLLRLATSLAVTLFCTTGCLAQRRPFIGLEMLRPVSRASYFAELGRSLAMEFVRIALVGCGLILLAYALDAFEWARIPTDHQITLIEALLITGSAVVAFGSFILKWSNANANVALARPSLFFSAWIIVTLLPTLLPVPWLRDWWPHPLVLCAIGVVAGVMMARVAYSRFLKAEFS